jgi:chemotaxis protein MotB
MKTEPVIILRKKSRHAHGHHGGAWKVAYADFVTAMMAFFLVMWITAQSPESRAGVAAYFRDPGAFDSGRGAGVLDDGNGVTTSAALPAGQGMAVLEKLAQELRREIERMPDLDAIKRQIEITVTREGLRIEMLEGDTEGFFQVGSATLMPAATHLLDVIASKLAGMPNKVAIEGHTDSRPFQSHTNYGNWELSADRANAARRAMQAYGLSSTQIAAVHGFANTRLRTPQTPLDARNRRVSILVQH